MKKKIKIDEVNQTEKQVKAEGIWYNVISPAKTSYAKIGWADVTLNDNEQITYLKMSEPPKELNKSKEDYFKNKDERITRMASLNTASSIIGMAILTENPKVPRTYNLIWKEVKALSEQIREYIREE